ncbi:hypothetical protein E2562_025187 [Oryza meyeriana var. granulata]|uniref:Uncharacterized protein n=1 Tax=Oryza meyeriana var. granulata TaxID=110450 RepID=A0A6G1E3U4_9ORYZ|nr:hypothetical protein E2562_025187 [Oryza meyeriana var. granulata]
MVVSPANGVDLGFLRLPSHMHQPCRHRDRHMWWAQRHGLHRQDVYGFYRHAYGFQGQEKQLVSKVLVEPAATVWRAVSPVPISVAASLSLPMPISAPASRAQHLHQRPLSSPAAVRRLAAAAPICTSSCDSFAVGCWRRKLKAIVVVASSRHS